MSMTEFLTFFCCVQEVLTNQSNKQKLFEFLPLISLNIQVLHRNLLLLEQCVSYKIKSSGTRFQFQYQFNKTPNKVNKKKT